MTLWGERPDARPVLDSDRVPVELGTAFQSTVDGTVTGVRFWKTAANTGTHVGHLWGPDGELLAKATFTNESKWGWQTVEFDVAVDVEGGERYVASYHAPNGRYVSTVGFMGQSKSSALSVSPGASGVYAYGESRYPTSSWRSSQYWVDVLFLPRSAPTRSPEPTPSSEPTSTPTPSRPPIATPTPAPPPPPASTPPPVATPTATPTPVPDSPAPPVVAGSGWTIDEHTVGLAPFGLKCADLPEYAGSQRVPHGTVISQQRITKELDLSAGAIVIERSCIQPASGSVGRGSPTLTTANWSNHNVASTKVVIRDSEFDGSMLNGPAEAAWVGPFQGIADLQRNYIHGFGSGISIFGTGGDLDALIEQNYVTGLVAWGDPATNGNHSSAFTVRDFAGRPDRQLVIRNNRFDEDTANATGALFIQPYADWINNVLIEGNLLEGEGYQLILQKYDDKAYRNMRAVNNRMTGTGHGATYASSGPGWTQWEHNYLYDPSASDGRGRLLEKPIPWE